MEIKTTEVETYTATIYVGFKDVENPDIGIQQSTQEMAAVRTIQTYCDKIGLCVTVTPTRFIYTKGTERGIAVGFINYPRFPDTISGIVEKATELAIELLDACKQINISIVYPNRTVMLTNVEKKERVAQKQIPGYTK